MYVVLTGRLEGFVLPAAQMFKRVLRVKVKDYGADDYFGESAVLDKSQKKRNNSVITRDECQLISLKRDDYEFFVNEKQSKGPQEFLASISIFSRMNCTDKQLKFWSNLFKIETNVKEGTLLYKEGDPVDLIYFVCSGEVMCSRRVFETELEREEKLRVTFSVEDEDSKEEIETILVSARGFFGETDSLEYFERMRSYIKEKELYKVDLKEKITAERNKISIVEGMAYQLLPNLDFIVPTNPIYDDNYVEEYSNFKFKPIEIPSLYRKEAAIVKRPADIFCINYRVNIPISLTFRTFTMS
jgi:CRP-like cAMP-binding protein